jgi:hypothetical protein
MLALVKKIQKLIDKNLQNIGKRTDNDIPGPQAIYIGKV